MGLLFSGCSAIQNSNHAKQTSGSQDIAQVIEFPSNKYPETAAHIKDAIANGKTDIYTIDRDGAAERTLKILRLQRFSATNLISSVFKEQSVQVYGSKHVGLC
ncbi:hypothetical protein [Bacillus toyonensis]|uniref:hypothetical protein n=1 Tax=Bacillus toyonensis TaxID=155322 RepID=UPI0026A8B472